MVGQIGKNERIMLGMGFATVFVLTDEEIAKEEAAIAAAKEAAVAAKEAERLQWEEDMKDYW